MIYKINREVRLCVYTIFNCKIGQPSWVITKLFANIYFSFQFLIYIHSHCNSANKNNPKNRCHIYRKITWLRKILNSQIMPYEGGKIWLIYAWKLILLTKTLNSFLMIISNEVCAYNDGIENMFFKIISSNSYSET